MSERTRLTIALVMTTLLLIAISVTGIVLHTGSTIPATSAPGSLVTQSAHANSSANWYEEHD